MKMPKEITIGKFLSGKGLDHLLEGIGDIVPGIRTIERLKDVILGKGSNLSEEDKKQFLEIYKLSLEELYKQLADTSSARRREKELLPLPVTLTGS